MQHSRHTRTTGWIPALLCLISTACQSSGGIVERLDPRTALTIVTDPSLLVFSRTEGRYSRTARDYLYLGPVEVNERGTRQYYLWVGVATTLDRPFLAAPEELPDRLYLELSGAPAELVLAPWEKELPRLPALGVYEAAPAPFAVLVARVTADQLVALAEQEIPSLRVATQDQPSREYSLWKKHLPWAAFSRYAENRLAQ